MFIFQLSICMMMWIKCSCEIDNENHLFYYMDPGHDFLVKNPDDVDLDFDVLVPIWIPSPFPGLTIATGILIDSNRILTAFNPFRELSKAGNTKNLVAYIKRGLDKPANDLAPVTIFEPHNIYCGRQVTYVTAEDKASMNYTGQSGNYPLHDLMILKIDKYGMWTQHVTEYRPYVGWDWFRYEPRVSMHHKAMKIDIADIFHELSGPMKIGSLEHRDYDTIVSLNFVYMNAVYLEEDAITDCGLWFPREWGYFICIKKPKSHVGIAAGAILIANQMVYGIGSFALEKGSEGIYVFTDVRVYKPNLNHACTKADNWS